MPKSLEINHLLRFRGEDATALEVLADALENESIPIYGEQPLGDPHAVDPVQVDLTLLVELADNSDVASMQLPSGVSYAGLTPVQRGAFHQWLQDPSRPAPTAFQRLFIAQIEVSLLDDHVPKEWLYRELSGWIWSDAWQNSEWYARVLLLALWLSGNGEGIRQWTSNAEVPPNILELAIGLQMLLEQPLSVEQFGRLAASWGIPGAENNLDILALRLTVVEEALGKAPLDAVREQLTDEELAPRPWRTAHRALRFSIPQPTIRPYLEIAFRDALLMADEPIIQQEQTPVSAAPTDNAQEWRLVVEFGQSRSEYYDHVLQLAQQISDYRRIMDEDRRIVHRLSVRKREMRRFWRIWDYIQGWSTTRVYLNGEELERWKIWPYSQYLR